MKPLHIALTGVMLAVPLQVFAQSGSGASATSQKLEASSGAIIMPPATDPGMVKQPPRNVDPGAISKPPANIDPEMVRKPAQDPGVMSAPAQGAGPHSESGSANAGNDPQNPQPNAQRSGNPRSAKDDCKGKTELCKQDSAR